ncbi:hypothetical protein ACWGQL_01505 [Streptomyces lydicus]
MDVTIPGALADHLADTNLATGADDHDPASKATREALDAGRRGRGRTLIITPKSTDVLNVISEYADAILINGEFHTRSEKDAARKWIERAGHARQQLAEQHLEDTTERAEAEVVDAEREQAATEQGVEVNTYYALRINGTPTGRLSKEYCEGVVELAAELDLARNDMVEITVTRAPGAPAATTTSRIIASSRPEELAAEQAAAEAEATDGTWRGEWIGEQPAADTLFTIEAGQGALFDDRATEATAPAVEERPAPIVVRASFRRDDLDRIRAKADADRAAHRAEFDARRAAEAARHTPAPRAVEGVIVEHAGAAEGSTPANATHPNVIAARAALDGLAVARMTDHHDVTEPTEAEQDVRGYMIDPREGDRVAVYWLEGGRIIRRDTPWHGPSLDCLADRLHRRGWRVEKMLKSSQCVFAHRPAND